MKLSNSDIREAISKHGLKMWEVAHIYGLSDSNFSRKLRFELPADEKSKIFTIIDELVAEREVN